MDTIFALASARGKAGVAVIRVSGHAAFEAARDLTGPLPSSRKAGLRRVSDRQGRVLDEALVLTFPGPGSFTGEDVVEFHLHGSIATIASVLSVLGDMPGLRLAEPGEFTRRALENERLDLAQVEGLSDLVEAETEAQRIQALRVFSGALGERAEAWRSHLIRAAALLEATIDFADEDVPVDVSPEVLSLIDLVAADLIAEEKGSKTAERIRHGFEVAIVGPPNAGKSTLLNALAGREAAITSDLAGTTRDVIEVRMDLAGLPVTVLDTAGLRETDDRIEGIGIERAIERAKLADLRVFLDTGSPLMLSPRAGDIVARAKSDTGHGAEFGVSGKTGAGIEALIARITKELQERASGAGLAIRERHRISIATAISALSTARIDVEAGEDRAEIAAENLRTAIRALESLVGRVDVEAVLDEIFASFCLGK